MQLISSFLLGHFIQHDQVTQNLNVLNMIAIIYFQFVKLNVLYGTVCAFHIKDSI